MPFRAPFKPGWPMGWAYAGHAVSRHKRQELLSCKVSWPRVSQIFAARRFYDELALRTRNSAYCGIRSRGWTLVFQPYAMILASDIQVINGQRKSLIDPIVTVSGRKWSSCFQWSFWCSNRSLKVTEKETEPVTMCTFYILDLTALIDKHSPIACSIMVYLRTVTKYTDPRQNAFHSYSQWVVWAVYKSWLYTYEDGFPDNITLLVSATQGVCQHARQLIARSTSLNLMIACHSMSKWIISSHKTCIFMSKSII